MDLFEQQRQLYQDLKDTFETPAGQRVLAWWRRQARYGHAVLVPGDSGATHFYLGRQAEIDTVMEVLRTDLEELLADLPARLARQPPSRPEDAVDDSLYPEADSEGAKNGQDR
jgi:hypothetical protein